eukprot:scaffold426135_cov43-Prasinocladus_malaysianus.AAC.2
MGLLIFALFTSTITSLSADLKAETTWSSLVDLLASLSPEQPLCTIDGVYLEFPIAQRNTVIKDSLEECYEAFEQKSIAGIMFDRPTFFYDLQAMTAHTGNIMSTTGAWEGLSSETLVKPAFDASSPGFEHGVVISEATKITYAAVAFPQNSPEVANGLHLKDIVNKALFLYLNYDGGIFA